MSSTVHLLGYDYRYAEAVKLIDRELERLLAPKVASRIPDVLREASLAYGAGSPDYRGIRDAWDQVFPDGEYSRNGLLSAVARAKQIRGR